MPSTARIYKSTGRSTMKLVGNNRFNTDKRKIAGVLLVISLTVCFFPLARLAPLINGNGETVDSGIEVSALAGNLIAMTLGLLGISLAWAELVHDYSNPNLTFAVSIFEIAAFVPYITDIVMIGKAANTGMAFIPAVFEPSDSDVWFVGAMGMLGAATFCLFLFGSQALLILALHAYQSNTPQTRNAGYYRTRLTFYSAVMAIAGLAQLMLGAYVLDKFGSGPLEAPVTVAMFLIWFPEIAVFVGLVYVLNGLYGMYRGLNKSEDQYFAFTMWFQLLCTLILMIVVQTTYAPGDMMAMAVPTLASLTLGVSLMPIFLDYMGRTQPEEIKKKYYFEDESKALKKRPSDTPTQLMSLEPEVVPFKQEQYHDEIYEFTQV